MGTASGVFKQVTYKPETTYGVLPAQSAAQALRRVTSSLNLSKDTFQSNEIRTDFQVADFRHGLRKVGGAIAGDAKKRQIPKRTEIVLTRDCASVDNTHATVRQAGATLH